MKEEKLPRTLQLYVDFIARAGRPVSFTEVVSLTPRVNKFRLLKERCLIINVVKGYERGEAYTGPRPPMYVLTERGMSFVSSAASCSK